MHQAVKSFSKRFSVGAKKLKAPSKRVFILIPVFNEEEKIGSVITGLNNAGYYNILVVNDGSSDKTAEISRRFGAEVIDHLINRGQGAALRTGIEYLRENYDPDVIITFDGDGQHQVEDLRAVLKPVIDGECDIALGSRFLVKSNLQIPFFRQLILRGGIIFTNLVSSVVLTDTHNGLRALGRRAIATVNIRQRGMEHASEIIDEIQKYHLRYTEVPVTIVYSDYSLKKGQKNFNFWKIGIKFLIRKLVA